MRSEHEQGGLEKRRAALSSVAAAVLLTLVKIVVGLFTGSLGIIAEAAHSALDLVAAFITFIAVRVSDRPADAEHHYGHGKIENLSALFEPALLLLTCVWIVYEALERLFFRHAAVDATIWAFLVMTLSIAVDASRARMLKRVAKKYNSQALEADALHFSTDIWSSAVVILGLLCVAVGDRVPQWAFLEKADAVAALGVALIVIYISCRLGIRTIHALLDTAPAGLADRIKGEVEKLDGVEDCHAIRVRNSGPDTFVDVHVLVDGKKSLADVHELTEVVEHTIQEVAPNADVTVHPEPVEGAQGVPVKDRKE